MVVPKNLNPRRFMSRLMASETGDEAGRDSLSGMSLIILFPSGRNVSM